jgi:Myb-like DNA-binding domain
MSSLAVNSGPNSASHSRQPSVDSRHSDSRHSAPYVEFGTEEVVLTPGRDRSRSASMHESPAGDFSARQSLDADVHMSGSRSLSRATGSRHQRRGSSSSRHRRKGSDSSAEPTIKGNWTEAEDEQLRSLVNEHGTKNWTDIAKELVVCFARSSLPVPMFLAADPRNPKRAGPGSSAGNGGLTISTRQSEKHRGRPRRTA